MSEPALRPLSRRSFGSTLPAGRKFPELGFSAAWADPCGGMQWMGVFPILQELYGGFVVFIRDHPQFRENLHKGDLAAQHDGLLIVDQTGNPHLFKQGFLRFRVNKIRYCRESAHGTLVCGPDGPNPGRPVVAGQPIMAILPERCGGSGGRLADYRRQPTDDHVLRSHDEMAYPLVRRCSHQESGSVILRRRACGTRQTHDERTGPVP